MIGTEGGNNTTMNFLSSILGGTLMGLVIGLFGAGIFPGPILAYQDRSSSSFLGEYRDLVISMSIFFGCIGAVAGFLNFLNCAQ